MKGHADRKTKEHQLIILEQLNIQADLLCGEKVWPLIQTHIVNTPIPVYIGKKYYSNKYTQAIHNHYGDENTKGFINEKNEWIDETI